MMVLVFSMVVWVLVALEGFRRKTGVVIAVGGGFIVACLSLIPVAYMGKYLDESSSRKAAHAVQQSPVTPAVQSKGLGIGYDKLIAALGPYAPDLKPAPTTSDGRARLLGQTQGGSAAIMEVSGKALSQAVEKATLNIAATQDARQNNVNAQLLGLYLDALFPEWPGRAEWAVNAIKSDNKDSFEVAGKRITFRPTVIAETKMLMFTAESI